MKEIFHSQLGTLASEFQLSKEGKKMIMILQKIIWAELVAATLLFTPSVI